MKKVCKETVFEGCYTAWIWSGSWLEKRTPYALKGWEGDRLRKMFREYLAANLNNSCRSDFVGFDEIVPKEVYRMLSRDPNKKFRFKSVVEVEEA